MNAMSIGRWLAATFIAGLLATAAIAQTTSSTSLAVSTTSPTQGQNVTLTATVTGTSPTGMVSFSDGSTALGTATLAGGVASFSTTALAVGSHGLTAAYGGNAGNTASTSGSVSVTVSARSGLVWQYGYDAQGRVNTQVDPNGRATYFYYDRLGRRIQSQQPPNTGSSSPTLIDYGYNAMDTLTSVTDPRSLATTYTPNGLGSTITQVSPDTGTSSYTYDAKGNVLTETDARGKVKTYTYDDVDRVTSITYSTGTATAFEYDGGSSPYAAAVGELTKMTDESGQTVYAYDAMGHLTTKAVTIGAKSFTVTYAWGDAGAALDKLTSITYPSGSKVNYSYASNGRISGITLNAVNANGSGQSATAQTLLSTVTYNVDGNVSGWLWSDSKARSIGYDSYGQVSSYTLGDPNGTGTAAGVLRALTRDAAGRITGYTHTNSGSAVTSLDQGFSYDDLNRLTSHTVNGTSYAYSYDATGNRTSKAVGGTTYTNTVASTSNRYTQTQDVGGTSSITHDSAGNITADGTNGYGYSDRGRMNSATVSGGTVSFLYNGLQQRAKKSGTPVATGASHFVYDEQGQLLGEYDANGAPVYETIYLGSTPVGALKQTGAAASSDIAVTIYNVSADQIDTPRLITNQNHTIVWRWDTAEAFGATVPVQNPSSLGTYAYNQRFPGQTFDAETGLNQNWNRDYQAKWGRFVQVDPIGLAGGTNTFAYVGAKPLSLIDSDGLQYAVPTPWGPMPVPLFPPAGNGVPAGGYDPKTDTFRPSQSWTFPDWKPTPAFSKPPENAYDPNGPKAPGKPGEAEGFKGPKGGDKWVPNPNGKGYGWQAEDGAVWCPTGLGGSAHGGPHWDVQYPGGGGYNSYPGGRKRDRR